MPPITNAHRQTRAVGWVFSTVAALAVGIVWILLFKLNQTLFTSVGFSTHIAWIFLPAAIRMVSVMVLEWVAVPGLFLGALVTSDPTDYSHFADAIVLSGMSAVGPMLAFLLCTRWLKLPDSLEGLNLRQLTVFGLVGALCNVIPHNIYFYLSDRMETPFSGVTPMFIGDVSGTLIVLYVAALILKYCVPKQR
jgi:hypothetical protein